MPSCKASSRAFGNMVIPLPQVVTWNLRFEGEMTESPLFGQKH
jgi:hypothetical protein